MQLTKLVDHYKDILTFTIGLFLKFLCENCDEIFEAYQLLREHLQLNHMIYC